MRSKRFDEALRELRTAVARQPVNPFLPFFLAWALQEKGDSVQAKRELRAADELDLDHAAAGDLLLSQRIDALRKALGGTQTPHSPRR